MSAMTNSPPYSHAGGKTLAGLAVVNVTVTSAFIAGPIGFARSAFSPEGISTESISGLIPATRSRARLNSLR